MKHRDLTPSFSKTLKGRPTTSTSGTKSHGVKVMEDGDDTLFTDDKGVERSVRHFAVELDDTSARADELEADLAAGVDRITAAETALGTLQTDTLPGLEAALGELDTALDAKSSIRRATSAPTADTPGTAVGDLWWQVDSLAASNVQGQWVWNGSAWTPTLVKSEVIANLDVSKLSAAQANLATAVVDKLFANIFAAKKIQAGQVDARSVAAAVGTFLTIDVGQLVVTGDATVNALVAQKIAAATAAIQQAYIQNLRTNGAVIDTAVIGDLAANLITSGMFRTGESGQRLEMTNDGLTLWLVDEDGEEYEGVHIGPTGTMLVTVGDVTIAPTSVTAPTVNAQALTIAGQSAAEFVDARVRTTGAQLVAIGGAGTAGGNITANASTETGLFDILVPEIRSDSWYRVDVLGVFYPSGLEVETRLGLRVSRGDQGVMTNSPRIDDRPVGVIRADVWDSKQTTFWFRGAQVISGAPNVTEGGSARLLLTVTGVGRSVNVGTATTAAVYREVTSNLAFSSTINRGGAPAAGSSTATPQAPVAQTQQYVRTYASTGYGTFYNSDNRQYTGGNEVIQGSYDGASSHNRYGRWYFPDWTGGVAGVTINNVEINIRNTHTYAGSGGTGHFYTANGAGTIGPNVMNAFFSRGQERWLSLPSQYWDSFKNGGARQLMAYTTSTSISEYARFANSAQVRITYTK